MSRTVRPPHAEANALFKAGDYEGAAAGYTAALLATTADAKLVTLYSNRAECYLRLQRLPEARHDVAAALEIDPQHAKTLKRRARVMDGLQEARAADTAVPTD